MHSRTCPSNKDFADIKLISLLFQNFKNHIREIVLENTKTPFVIRMSKKSKQMLRSSDKEIFVRVLEFQDLWFELTTYLRLVQKFTLFLNKLLSTLPILLTSKAVSHPKLGLKLLTSHPKLTSCWSETGNHIKIKLC